MAVTTSSPMQRYDAIRVNSNFIFVVCTYSLLSPCPIPSSTPKMLIPAILSTAANGVLLLTYLKQFQSLQERITAAGGHVLTVTAEAESELPKMQEASGYTGESIVDTENLFVKELKRHAIIDVAICEKKGYPHGMAQPTVLVGTKQKVVYNWAIQPSLVSCSVIQMHVRC